MPDRLPHATFSRAEMARRHAGAREMMAAQGLAALVVTCETNFQYFAGTSASLALYQSLTRPSIFILPLEGDPVIVTQGGDSLALSCDVTDVRAFTALLKFPADMVADALAERGVAGKRVGVELGQEQRMEMPVGDYLEVVESMPGTEFVDAAPILLALRRVKSPEEVDHVREAAAITGRARQRLFAQIRPGMTEREVARDMRRMVLEEGGDDTGFVIFQHRPPGGGNPFHYERPIEEGTLLALDSGARVGMYGIDYMRAATVGPASPEQRHIHEAVLALNQRMIDALRPGLACSALFQVWADGLDALGVAAISPVELLHGRCGHGQGLLAVEPPSNCATDHTVLEPGTIISTEPGVRIGDAELRWEDVHVITEDGHEQLTLETTELIEIG
jgi:Xaa-Pro aminopeptidase